MSALREQANRVAERLLARVPRGEDACAMVTWRAESNRVLENAFAGAVMLRAVARSDAPAALREWRGTLAERLRGQVSARGSWNYWLRDTAIARERACPDDLDTTICATTALARHDGVVPPAHLASVIHILTALEISPGGPYRTWYTSPDDTKWADVDPVVNAHVGWFLREQGVTLPRLGAWATGAIDSALTSPYYPSRVPFLYAVAHWYDGPAKERLREQLWQALRTAEGSPLVTAMCVTALCRLGEPFVALLPYAPLLAAPDDAALLQPFWIDGVWAGVPTFAGGEGLTLAMCYEGLCVLADAEDAAAAAAERPTNFAVEMQEVTCLLHAWAAALPTPLDAQASEAIAAMLARDAQHRRTLFPWLLARAATGVPWSARAAAVCVANALGWLAYTLYDDVLDGDADASVLGLANAAARQAVTWCGELKAVFDRMDAANAWELAHCALVKSDEGWRVPAQLPPMTDAMLWERSLGAAFLPTVLAANDGVLQEVQCALIAARQLSDDAHDWEQDLLRGRVNSVAVRILRAAGMWEGDVMDASTLARLRRVFWEEVLDDVVVQAQTFTRNACARFAGAYPQGDVAFVEKLAAHAVQGMEKARATRDETRVFLAAYRG